MAQAGARHEAPKKRVTAFVGSGRKGRGLTHAATRQLLDDLESFGDVQGEIVFLSDFELGLCRGCKACFDRGEERCPLKGDRDLLIGKMLASDGVIFASPNYSFQVSAIMKAFLDRLGYLFHRPRFHGRAFTSVVAQGIGGGEKIERYLRHAGSCLGFDVVKGSCVTSFEPMPEGYRAKMDEILLSQAERFHRQLSRPADRAPSLFHLIGFRMARTSIRNTLTEESRDYTWYRDHGYFEADFYRPVRLGLVKKALGALLDRIFARVYPPAQGRPVEVTRSALEGAPRP